MLYQARKAYVAVYSLDHTKAAVKNLTMIIIVDFDT